LATKAEVQKRRLALKQFVTQGIKTGDLVPGQILPPVRELAKQHQLSLSVVNQAMQELAGDGLLYLVPRVGTFVGQPQGHSAEIYLLIMPDPCPPDPGNEEESDRVEREARNVLDRIELGFEERISQLGGTGLVMTAEQAVGQRDSGGMPPLAGVFNYDFAPIRTNNWHTDGVLPHVGFTSWAEDREHYDLVSFDDVDGGRQATQCLIAAGHKRIAYLALHPANADPGILLWSAEREMGWRDAMTASGLFPDGLAFHPDGKWLDGEYHHYDLGQRTARSLIFRPEISAVVAANDAAAFGMIAALKAADLPSERWPAVIGFDNASILAKARGQARVPPSPGTTAEHSPRSPYCRRSVMIRRDLSRIRAGIFGFLGAYAHL